MKKYIEERAAAVGQFIVDNNSTVRETARAFGVSKSTVHKDVNERLAKIDPRLAIEAQQVIANNKADRHNRAGNATREKYLKLKTLKE
ncbi:MAG: sporulation transcriptional regulator SpoIIID [Oscillospiraceae bacterium]|nr:sporulation transcriptional regulator SpoIIID [Oscillospiraceae bacterium]